MTARYAIYFAPERDTRLWHFGNRVLGRDAETGETVPQIVPDGFDPADWQTFTASPRRYGFHATLKAPFALAEGCTEDELFAAARQFAQSRNAIDNLTPVPTLSGRHVVLSLDEADAGLVGPLADACVAEFHAFCAPPSQEDKARRASAGLSDRQKEHLERWGYPYVFDDFTFHMTLAGPLPPDRRDEVLTALKTAFAEGVKGEAAAIRSLAVFAEPASGEPLRLVLRAPLAG